MIRIVYVERTARTGKHPHHFGRVNLGNRTLQRTKYPGNLVVRTSLQRIVNAAYHCSVMMFFCSVLSKAVPLLPTIASTWGMSHISGCSSRRYQIQAEHIGCGSAPKVRVLYALLCQVGNDRNGVLTCVARIRHIFGLYGVHKVRPVRITEIKTKVS